MSETVQAQVAAVLHKQLTADEQREIVARVVSELKRMRQLPQSNARFKATQRYSFGYTDPRVVYGRTC